MHVYSFTCESVKMNELHIMNLEKVGVKESRLQQAYNVMLFSENHPAQAQYRALA